MPVFNVRRTRDNIASTDHLHRLAFLLGESNTRGHNQSLTCWMRMPGGAGTRFKGDQQRLKQASDARAQEVAGSEVLYSGDANLTDEQIAKLPFALYPTQVSNSWSMVCHH